MATEPEDVPSENEDGYGGPVKTFLEHLEDLRWMLLKVVTSLVLGMLICFVGGKYLVHFLTYPLRLATQLTAPKEGDFVAVQWGTNTVAKFARTNLAEVLPGQATNTHVFRVIPRQVGDQLVLGLQPDPSAPPPKSAPSIVFLKNYSPLSAFMVAIKLALYGGFVLSLPFIVYFIGQFVIPALKLNEKQFLLRALAFGSILFLMGLAFCYLLMLQVALTATVQFSQWLGFGADEWRAEDYISFVCMFMLVTGLSFELPIPILALVKIGLLDYSKLSKFRAYWVVIELVICAFLTPSGDPFTMMLMAIPLHLLYEISTAIAWYWAWKDRRAKAEAQQGTS